MALPQWMKPQLTNQRPVSPGVARASKWFGTGVLVVLIGLLAGARGVAGWVVIGVAFAFVAVGFVAYFVPNR
jgi:hypothetical protein